MIFTNLRKMTFLLTILVFMVVTVSAQDKQITQNSTPEQRAKMQTEWMKTNLALSQTQVDQVYNLNLQYAQKNAPILESTKGKLYKYKQLKASQEEKSAAISKILDAEQYRKYQELQEQMMKTIKEKRK
ncbi:hypothetical protein DCC81_17890 [Chitinophaga parva]|uniref:DUF4890 domain-containing protein n=2 Tax=Chitinophaga parva TaxID=2169414 RepID=A0A2T7BIJ2_9BACT|nr:hypothetical protein DCC81_17890 [Chitinophaga parva]